LTATAVADQEDILPAVEAFPHQKFPDQRFIDRGDASKIEGLQGLDYGEPGILDPSFGGPTFPVQQFPFADSQVCLPDRQVWRAHDAYHRAFREAMTRFSPATRSLELLAVAIKIASVLTLPEWPQDLFSTWSCFTCNLDWGASRIVFFGSNSYN
jgi:hypothetical protein